MSTLTQAFELIGIVTIAGLIVGLSFVLWRTKRQLSKAKQAATHPAPPPVQPIPAQKSVTQRIRDMLDLGVQVKHIPIASYTCQAKHPVHLYEPKCKTCGATLDWSSFTQQPQPPQVKACSNCGSPQAKPGAKFCAKCGKPV